MQVIFLIRQDDRKSLRMKSTAKQEHNLNCKRNSYIPKMSVDPCPVGSTTLALWCSERKSDCNLYRNSYTHVMDKHGDDVWIFEQRQMNIQAHANIVQK